MKKLLRQLMILCLAVLCLAVFVACGSPGDEFAGEYVMLGNDYQINSITDISSDTTLKFNEITDTNVINAINGSIAMVGTKVKLTAKEVWFRDSDTKFDVESYGLLVPSNDGQYDIKTSDEKLLIYIFAYKATDKKNSEISINVYGFITGVDEKEYGYLIIFTLRGENK